MSEKTSGAVSAVMFRRAHIPPCVNELLFKKGHVGMRGGEAWGVGVQETGGGVNVSFFSNEACAPSRGNGNR
jgi:hypothetical protein